MEKQQVPSNVAAFLTAEIERWTAYRIQREQTEKPPEFKRTLVAAYQAEMSRLDKNLETLISTVIIPLAKKYIPDLQLDEKNHVLTIASILSNLPRPELIVKPRQLSARG